MSQNFTRVAAKHYIMSFVTLVINPKYLSAEAHCVERKLLTGIVIAMLEGGGELFTGGQQHG